MGLRTFISVAAVVAGAGFALANQLPDGYGVATPSGSKFTSEISPAGDSDDYVFDGYAGQKVTATVKADKDAKKAKTALDLTLTAPNGTVITAATDGAKVKDKVTSVKFQYTLNQSGVWKVRVATKNPADTAGYTVSVKYTAPKVPKLKKLDLDTNPDRGAHFNDGAGQYIFGIPGIGGAIVTATFSFKGGETDIAFLTDPNGDLVAIPETFVKRSTKKIQIKKFVIPAALPAGDYILGFNDEGARSDPQGELLAKVGFSAAVKIPKSPEKKRKATLDANKPKILQFNPPVGGPGTALFFQVQHPKDRGDVDGTPILMVGGKRLTDVQDVGTSGDRFQGTVPNIGGNVGDTFDIVYMTSTGQLDVETDAFSIVPAPVVESISVPSGSVNGGFELTITGRNFRPIPAVNIVTIEGFDLPLVPSSASESSITFTAPQRSPGFVAFGIKDRDSGLADSLAQNTFEYIAAPSIIRVSPNLAPVTGGDLISVVGVNFDPGDQVFIENEVGGFDPLPGTYISDQRHSFLAPVRAKGAYEVFVRDPQGQDTPGDFYLSYFTFSDFTGSTALDPPPGPDLFDAHTTALGDYDNDGNDDLFLSHVGGDDAETQTQTRVLRNDGTGAFTDVTALVMPAVTATDDWRADRIVVRDLDDDSFADIAIVTNSEAVPADNVSHVRILRNVPKIGGGREFRDATGTLMAPVRMKAPFSFGGGNLVVGDNWRGLDMWIGDIDNSSDNRPEILIVHDELKDEPNSNCGNYCTSPLGSGATYNFYWGGSRAFRWDPAAAGGNGRFKFDVNFFPRRSGVGVPIPIPGGGQITGCSAGCRGKFTPFIGQKIAVGHIDTDGKKDVAVLSNATVTRDTGQISSLQVAVNRPSIQDGSSVTDATPSLTSLGGDYKGDTLTIGQPFDFFGAIAISKRASTGSRVLKILQAKAPFDTEQLIPDFEEISNTVLPVAGTNDKFQAAEMHFVDANGDALQDLVLVAPAAPGGNEMAFRILRATVSGQDVVLRETFEGLLDALTSGGEYWEGDVLTLGDIDNDEALEFVITRETPKGAGTQTRVITTDK